MKDEQSDYGEEHNTDAECDLDQKTAQEVFGVAMSPTDNLRFSNSFHIGKLLNNSMNLTGAAHNQQHKRNYQLNNFMVDKVKQLDN